MKKSVSELQNDLAAANKQINLAKESGNKRQLNLGRQMRLETWRELRDEHGMTPPAHIAKALGEPKKAKEPTEFKKPIGQKPEETIHMDFTKFASKTEEEAFFADQRRAIGDMRVAKKVEMPKKKASSGELRAQVRAWLSKDAEYVRLVQKIARHNELADEASKLAKKLGPEKSDRLMKALDSLFVNRHTAIETERQLEKLLMKKEAQFKKEHASDTELAKSYSADLKKFSEMSVNRVFFPFSSSEGKMMGKVAYNYHARRREESESKARAEIKVRGKNRLEEEMKKVLLEKAQDLMDGLEEEAASNPDIEPPSEEEKKSMQDIERAARNPDVDSAEMLRVAANLTDDEASSAELALAGETVERLETRVAMAEQKKPVRVASRSSRKEKKPVKVASLERKKREKEV